MILVDSSVWIGHLHRRDHALVQLLEVCDVMTHDLVIGELAMGRIAEHTEFLALLNELPRAPIADHHEVMALIESKGLHGRRLGVVDAHLMASTLLDPGARLWTRERRLAEVAASLGVDGSEHP